MKNPLYNIPEFQFIITAVNEIGINPLKLQVYFKPLLMSKLIDLVKKYAWCLA